MVDGDQLNAIADPIIVTVAERNIKEFDIVPLYYDANKASPEIISNAALYHGLIRAHKFSNIGEISNMLTRLWNQDNPNYLAAALLAYLNNLRITRCLYVVTRIENVVNLEIQGVRKG